MGQNSLGAITELDTPLHCSSMPRTSPSITQLSVSMSLKRLGCPLVQDGREDAGFCASAHPKHWQLQAEGPPSLPETRVVMLGSMEAAGGPVILETFSKQNDYSLKQLLHTTFCAHVPLPVVTGFAHPAQMGCEEFFSLPFLSPMSSSMQAALFPKHHPGLQC